jgi:hypothetical protein
MSRRNNDAFDAYRADASRLSAIRDVARRPQVATLDDAKHKGRWLVLWTGPNGPTRMLVDGRRAAQLLAEHPGARAVRVTGEAPKREVAGD